jgi:hypothetical protein
MDSCTYDRGNKIYNKLKSATGCYNTILWAYNFVSGSKINNILRVFVAE